MGATVDALVIADGAMGRLGVAAWFSLPALLPVLASGSNTSPAAWSRKHRRPTIDGDGMFGLACRCHRIA